MDPFHVWIKTKRDLNSLNDEAFSQMESEILLVFGGVKALLNVALKFRRNVDYNTLLKLSEILYCKAMQIMFAIMKLIQIKAMMKAKQRAKMTLFVISPNRIIS